MVPGLGDPASFETSFAHRLLNSLCHLICIYVVYSGVSSDETEREDHRPDGQEVSRSREV